MASKKLKSDALALSAGVEAAIDCRLPGSGDFLSKMTDPVGELAASAAA